jgi:hypothetical protein
MGEPQLQITLLILQVTFGVPFRLCKNHGLPFGDCMCRQLLTGQPCSRARHHLRKVYSFPVQILW